MIPSHELRLGNYVLVEQKIEQVSMINAVSSATTALTGRAGENTEAKMPQPLENLLPVPLTDAVLRQCHFVFHDYFNFWQLLSGTGETRSEMDIDRDYNILDFMRRPVVKKLTSLHQLQNIYFMLKGKEITFHHPLSPVTGAAS